MKKLITVILFLFSTLAGFSQINAYAKVDTLNGANLRITASNEAFAQFMKDSLVIIFQMQDDVIGSNTGNNIDFGNLGSLNSAGYYEVARINQVIRTGGIVSSIIIGHPISGNFKFGPNSSVQVVSFPKLGGNGYTTTSNITALPWNGSFGGVVAFEVTGTLNLNHNIIADNAGFRGGAINGGNAGSCEYIQYRLAQNELNGNKGEGIYKATNALYAAGRAKILNGGGGGNSHNGGGGGGSNFTGGGEGGRGYGCSSNAGGLGGLSLGIYLSHTRMLLGGGGGAGEANNGFNSAGGNGGGVIFIKASTIKTTGTGAALKISANGQTSANVGNDGAGGGGAAGSILLQVNSYDISATRPLEVSANGGTGGSVSDGAFHAGGGGGGQGVVYLSATSNLTGVSLNTLNGIGGRNSSTGTYAENGTGSNNSGIITGTYSILPVHLLSFKGSRNSDAVILEWYTENETALKAYEIEKSVNGKDFIRIGTVVARNIADRARYTYNDRNASADAYYRLKMIDIDGKFRYSNLIRITSIAKINFNIQAYPNPTASGASLKIITETPGVASIRIFNSLGLMISAKNLQINSGESITSLAEVNSFGSGVYTIQVNFGSEQKFSKLIVQK